MEHGSASSSRNAEGSSCEPPRQRADRLLVERGLFESRAKAQAAIEAGLVFADDRPVRKASEEIATDAVVRASAAHPYVSRGGVKLAAALDHFGFDPKGRVCLDVGASTGGFTQVLLERGAQARLCGRRRTRPVARQPARRPDDHFARSRPIFVSLPLTCFDEAPDLVTVDVSFISLKLVLPSALALAKDLRNLSH